MKLDPIFTIKNNILYKIDDNSQVATSTLKQIQIKWSTVEISDEAYNEEYLAQLREDLKSMEEAGTFAVLVPVVDKPLESPEQTEAFINTFNHTARRVKDCESVAGFVLPEEIASKDFAAGSPAQDFMETLAIKHAQYVYFVKADSASKNGLPDNISTI
ncbi:MAG: hypothetical protein J6T20_05875 [Treponema sp.]|nr:hypothetical protein [Treponema sp.]